MNPNPDSNGPPKPADKSPTSASPSPMGTDAATETPAGGDEARQGADAAPKQSSATPAAGAADPGSNLLDRLPGGGPIGFGFVAAMVIAVLLGWQWHDLRKRAADTEDQLARRATAEAAAAAELRGQLGKAQEQAALLQDRVGALEERLAELSDRGLSLDGLSREIAQGRDEWLLTEVEQLVTLAVQQLQFAGNVQAATQALAAAEARLGRSQRPQLVSLRKAIGQDLLRLKSTPSLDLQGIGVRLENIAAAIDLMPLAHEARPAPAPAKAPATGRGAESRTVGAAVPESYWDKWVREAWAEFRSLIHVERIDRPDPIVLAPNQAFFLRESMKLRLLSARTELFSRSQAAFRTEVKFALQGLEKHFDGRDRRVQNAVETLKPLLATDFTIEAPSLSGSLGAVRATRLPVERGPR